MVSYSVHEVSFKECHKKLEAHTTKGCCFCLAKEDSSLHVEDFHFGQAARGGCSVVSQSLFKVGYRQNTQKDPSFLPYCDKCLVLLCPILSLSFSFTMAEQRSCLNDFTCFCSDALILMFQFCRFVVTKKGALLQDNVARIISMAFNGHYFFLLKLLTATLFIT